MICRTKINILFDIKLTNITSLDLLSINNCEIYDDNKNYNGYNLTFIKLLIINQTSTFLKNIYIRKVINMNMIINKCEKLSLTFKKNLNKINKIDNLIINIHNTNNKKLCYMNYNYYYLNNLIFLNDNFFLNNIENIYFKLNKLPIKFFNDIHFFFKFFNNFDKTKLFFQYTNQCFNESKFFTCFIRSRIIFNSIYDKINYRFCENISLPNEKDIFIEKTSLLW